MLELFILIFKGQTNLPHILLSLLKVSEEMKFNVLGSRNFILIKTAKSPPHLIVSVKRQEENET